MATCECSDPGCPVEHGSKDCEAPATFWLKRLDMGDGGYDIPMCEKCCEDAMDSGVFDCWEART